MTEKNLGSVSQYPLLQKIYSAVCGDGKNFTYDGKTIKVGKFVNKNLFYVEMDGLRYVQQNPNSQSAYALRARRGVKIMWIIRLSDDVFMGRVENDTVFKKG